MDPKPVDSGAAPTVLVIGSGARFVSGISHYTFALSSTLSQKYRTSVLLMRNLIPRRLYPGAERVGKPIASYQYPPEVKVYDGIDWFWLPSMFTALRFLWKEQPSTIVVQWWTAAVAHSYLLLVIAARFRGARVVLELHETQDTGEARIPLAAAYGRSLLKLLTRMTDGFVTHSAMDQQTVLDTLPTRTKPVEVIHHGPYNHYIAPPEAARREADDGTVNLVFFGTIRPYKGLEDLIRAFDTLPEPSHYWLTVIGETWEDWTLPARLISESPVAERITFINRYITDSEAASWLAGADALVLPYRRSSASGPLHIGMALGLPVIVSDLPALAEVATGYKGAQLVTPGDIDGLRDAILRVRDQRGCRFRDPSSWEETRLRYGRLIDRLVNARHVATTTTAQRQRS